MFNHDVLRPGFGGQVFPTAFNNNGFAPAFVPGYSMAGFTSPWNTLPYGYSPGFSTGYPSGGPELGMIQNRVDALTSQIAHLTELVCRSVLNQGVTATAGMQAGLAPQQGAYQPFGVNPALNHALRGQLAGIHYGRVRESDSHLFWEVAFPGLSMGDCEVEINGNRVICRTRVPLRNQLRTVDAHDLPRGLEIFELPDGRCELNWLVPVSFIGKEVEASWKDGWIQICIPKAEVSTRQSVKIAGDSVANGGARKNGGTREMTA